MEREVFLDTAYAIALASPRDQLHSRAEELAEQIQAGAVKLITTRAVMLEIGNALSKLRYRRAGTALLNALEADPNVGIVPLTESIFLQAVQLFQGREDKEWGLTDCVSFVVMQERKIVGALTADEHFIQAGFQALLRES